MQKAYWGQNGKRGYLLSGENLNHFTVKSYFFTAFVDLVFFHAVSQLYQDQWKVTLSSMSAVS